MIKPFRTGGQVRLKEEGGAPRASVCCAHMSLLAPLPGATGPLDPVLRRAGAVFGVHGGDLVALNFGSAAGELAACVHGVGLADRSEVAKLEVHASAAQLSDLIALLAGRGLADGEAVN